MDDNKKNPKITVVITTYNAGQYLIDAVESVLDQTFKDWNLIIIDDASTDQSLASIHQYLEDEKIQIIKNSENVGQTRSLNIALEHVTTPFMVQLDSDDWFDPHTLEVLDQKTNDIDDDVALICGNIKIVWQDRFGKEIRSRIKKGRSFSDPYDFMLSNLSCWPRFYRTAALKDVGGWPTDGPYEGRYIEDLRILYRLIPKYQFLWIDQTLYIHRRHKNNMTNHVNEMKTTLYWLIRKTLKEWGAHYTPKYKLLYRGYPKLVALIPKNRRRKRRKNQAVKKKYGKK